MIESRKTNREKTLEKPAELRERTRKKRVKRSGEGERLRKTRGERRDPRVAGSGIEVGLMRGTSVREFNRWLKLIPGDFDLHFIPIRENQKSPSVPKGDSWKDDEHRLTTSQATERLKKGGNVGFVARRDIAVIDVDDEERAREILEPKLFDTLTVETRSGGTHRYYVNCGVGNRDVSGVMEVRANWRYVLVPGSYVPPGDTGGPGLYGVKVERIPTAIFPTDLPQELTPKARGGGEIIPVFKDPEVAYTNRYGWTLDEIRESDEKLDELLTTLNPAGYPSISEADFATCVKLLYWEFDLGACASILTEHRRRGKVLERPAYVERTIQAATSRVGETISDRVNPEEWTPGSIFDQTTIPKTEEERDER